MSEINERAEIRCFRETAETMCLGYITLPMEVSKGRAYLGEPTLTIYGKCEKCDARYSISIYPEDQK